MKREKDSSATNETAQPIGGNSSELLIESLCSDRMPGVPDVSAMVDDFAEAEFYKCRKTGIVTRHATPAEKIRLMTTARQSGGGVADLLKGPCWVAEIDGQIIGCLRARLIFEVQPFPVQTSTTPEINNRADALMLEACHRWMRSFRNGLGVDESFQVATTPDRQSLLKRLGWKAVNVAQSTLFGKNFGGNYDGK
jgi:hypothetical protein